MVTCCGLLKVQFLFKSVNHYGTGFQRGQQEVSSEYSQLGKEAKDSLPPSPAQIKLKKPLLHRKRDLEEAPQCPCLQGKARRGKQEWEASWVLREVGVGSVESGWAPRCSSISEV